MRERGYPVEDFEQQAADVSVDHPEVVEHYRRRTTYTPRPRAPRTNARRWSTTARCSGSCSSRPPREHEEAIHPRSRRSGNGNQETRSSRDSPIRRARTRHEPSATSRAARNALFQRDENAAVQGRWEAIQTGFVDEPRQTVEQADELVAEVMKRLAESFAAERERLERQWGRGEDVSTEDLRVALQRYRDFFQRLLSA